MKTFRAVLAVLAIICTVSFASEARADYSNGYRMGEVMKFSEKGMFVKSFEGQMTMGNASGSWVKLYTDSEGRTQRKIMNPWAFSVTSPAIAQQVNSKLGDFVVLKYRQSMIHNPLATDTDYDIVGVLDIGEPLTRACTASTYTKGGKSDGTRIGRIVKASQKGTFVDSFEIVIQVGNSGSNFIEMSISKDEDLYKCAVDFLKAGQKVKIHYSQSSFNLSLSRDTTYDIIKLEPIIKAKLN